MPASLNVGRCNIQLVRGDITDLDIEAFVFYARHDLQLGSGYGTAISVRGGPAIQEELKPRAPLETTEVVISGAGEMKSKYIVHAVGPRFMEENVEGKLRQTVVNCLKQADEKGIKKIAFPPMGTGFYGIPLEVSTRVIVSSLGEYLANGSGLEEVLLVALDSREYVPFEKQLMASAAN